MSDAALRHAVALADNSLRWAEQELLTVTLHPGACSHLRAARTQIVALLALLAVEERASEPGPV